MPATRPPRHRAMQRAWARARGRRRRACTSSVRTRCRTAAGWARRPTAIVAGIVAAQALHDVARGARRRRRPRASRRLARRARGAPRQRVRERASAASRSSGPTRRARHTTVTCPVHPDVEPVVFVPDRQLVDRQGPLGAAATVPHADAAANAGRAALLVARARPPTPRTCSRPPGTGCTRRPRRGRTPPRWRSSTRCAARPRRRRLRRRAPRPRARRAGAEVDERARRGAATGWRVLTPGVRAARCPGARSRARLTGPSCDTPERVGRSRRWRPACGANIVALATAADAGVPRHPAATCAHHEPAHRRRTSRARARLRRGLPT